MHTTMSLHLLAPLLMFTFMMYSFISNYSHFLMSLLCLEGMILSLVLLLPNAMINSSMPNPATSLIMLSLGACEASLGLSILVKISRAWGSDLMMNLTKNKC